MGSVDWSVVTVAELVAPWAIFLASAFVLYRIIKAILPTWRNFDQFLRDWQGEERTDGVEGRKGVMATLQDHSDTLTAHSKMLTVLSNNKKELDRLNEKVDILGDRIERVEILIKE